jgi:hypothetical protein
MSTKTTDLAGRAAKATEGTEAIEVKLTVVERQEDAVLEKFGLDRKQADRRRIYFFDTPKLALFKKGVVLRARETVGEGSDSTVKIRPVEPNQVDASWRRKNGFKLEADSVGEKVIRSASFTSEQDEKEVDEVVSGSRPIEKLFSGDQEAFLAALSPVAVDFGKLVALGPIASLRWKFRNPGLPYEICAEEWRLPNGHDLLELSIKATRAQAAASRAAFEGFLGELGFEMDAGQQTKTRAALEYLAHGT